MRDRFDIIQIQTDSRARSTLKINLVFVSKVLLGKSCYDQSIASTKTKYIKLNTKTQIFFLTTFDFCIHFKRENFFFSFCFLVAPVKVYKKVVKFSFKRQKIFWVLVFSFMYLVLVDAMDRSKETIRQYN